MPSVPENAVPVSGPLAPAGEGAPTPTPRRRPGGLWGKVLVSVALGGLLAWLVTQGGVPLIPSAESFSRIVWWTVPAYVVLAVGMQFVRATRWRFLIAPIKPLRLKEVVWLNWIGFFMIFALPLRLGEFARPVLTKMRHSIPLSAGFGTVVAERVVDGLVTSLCVLWGLFGAQRLPPTAPFAKLLPTYGLMAVAGFGSLLVALVLFVTQRRWTIRWVRRLLGWVPERITNTIVDKLDGMADGLRSLVVAKHASGFLLETVLYWGLNVLGTWLLAWGCGAPLSASQAVGLVGILAIGVLLPAGPGMFGSFQIAVSAALQLYLAARVVETQGALFIFMIYSLQWFVILACGVLPLYKLDISIRTLMRPGAADSENNS